MPKFYDLFLRGWVGSGEFTTDSIKETLDNKKGDDVFIVMDSLGGDTAQSISIASLFRLHGKVNVHFTGLCASAATIAAMGAKHISIDSNALVLVHKCQSALIDFDFYNADELQRRISELENLRDNNKAIDWCVAGIYASRCKKSKDELLSLMGKDTWLSAKEALDWGFVDEVVNDDSAQSPVLNVSVAEELSGQGLPMPPLTFKKESIIDKIKSIFYSNSSASLPMKFSYLAAAAGGSLSCSADCVSLSSAQAEAVEAKFSSLNEKLEKNVATIAELESRVVELSKEPASNTSSSAPKPVSAADPQKVAAALINALR